MFSSHNCNLFQQHWSGLSEEFASSSDEGYRLLTMEGAGISGTPFSPASMP